MTSASRILSPPATSWLALAPRSLGVARLAVRRDFAFLAMSWNLLKATCDWQSRRSLRSVNSCPKVWSEAGADRLLDAEHTVLAETLLVGLDDLDDFGLV